MERRRGAGGCASGLTGIGQVEGSSAAELATPAEVKVLGCKKEDRVREAELTGRQFSDQWTGAEGSHKGI